MIVAIFTSAEVAKNETWEFLSSIYSFHRFITRAVLHLRTSYDNAHVIVRDKCKIIFSEYQRPENALF